VLIAHRRGAKDAEIRISFFLSADPGGIGFAFHRAGTAERKKQPFKISEGLNHNGYKRIKQ
jgi:hypothetical protein